MTKEQTIKHLKLMQSGARNAIRYSKNDKEISEEERKEDIEIYQDQLEALDMAIKALEQQSSDCVSREAVFETIDDCNSDGLKGIFCSYDDGERFKEYIKKLPPVTPTQSWISVSERLPRCEQKVLVLASYRNKTHVITTGMYEDGSLSEYDSIWRWEDMDFEKWDDENDCGIIPEGWYEYHEYNPDGVLNYAIDTKVIAWQPLPKPYEEKRGSEE